MLGFLALSFLIFGNGITGSFVLDDVAVIENRGELKEAGGFFDLFVSPYHQNMPKSGLFRPLTMASYSLNYLIFGSSPVSFHVINIIIHGLNSFLVFWLVKYFLKSRTLAYLASLLFLFHPIHTEAVTSIVGRAELLAFLFSLVSVYFISKNKKILAAVAFFMGLVSKETTLMILPIIFYLDLAFKNKSWREILSDNLFFIFPAVIYSFLRYLALGEYFVTGATTTIVENPLKFMAFPERIFTALEVLFIYFKKILWPVHLSADYSYNTIPVVKNIFGSPASLIGLLILGVIVVMLVWRKTRGTGFGLAAAMFLFPYLIISNIFLPIGTIMGERLMYFPSLGLVVVLAVLFNFVFRKQGFYKKAGYSIVAIILVFYGARTVIRNKDWRNNETLFKAAAAESPNSLLTRTGLGAVYIRKDEWGKAEEQLTIARNIHEDNSHLQNLLGILEDHKGNFKLAEERFKRSIELNSDAINAYINLAELQIKQQRFKEAGENFLKVIDFTPVFKYVLRYAFIQIAIGQPDEAIKFIEEKYGQNFSHPDLNLVMGNAYFVKEDYGQAVYYLEKSKNSVNFNAEAAKMLEISKSLKN